MTLVEMLKRNCAAVPDRPAIIHYDRAISYFELDELSARLSAGLIGMGLSKGDRIGLMLPRVPELVISFLAAAFSHGVAAPINYELTPENIRDIIKSITPRFLILSSSLMSLAKSSIPEGMDITLISVGDKIEGAMSFDELIKSSKPQEIEGRISEDDLVYLNFTSGSTGDSKGAITTHANIYWNTAASVETLGLTEDDIHLCMFAPFAHPHEIFARPLFLGGTMVLLDKVYPKSIAEAISKNRVTCMMGLSPMYENLLDVLDIKHYDLSSLRIPESGGMFTRPDLIERFRKKIGVPIIPVWGSTETTGIALANTPGENPIPGSIGKPCRYYEVRIVDEDGSELPHGEVGEMIFKGPAVVSGYYGITGQDAPLNDNWYFSGDLGKKDEEGNFYFVDRKSGMMKIAGLKVYPMEIEKVLMEHPSIKDVAVISINHALRGEVPKAIVSLKDGFSITEREIMAFCRERLPNYKAPKVVEIRASLPKIGSGKVNKKVLRMEHI